LAALSTSSWADSGWLCGSVSPFCGKMLCSSWAYDAARELQGVVVGELLAVLGVDLLQQCLIHFDKVQWRTVLFAVP